MRLLVYGGCHALIIKRLIDELGPTHHHRVDLLINFELVASGQPFPYEHLSAYDAIIYSPIQNKGAYNTVHLDEACAAAGVQAIRFPWLEWHGHAPGADKGRFWGHHGWYFPGLVELGRQFDDIQAFRRQAREMFPSADTIRDVISFSTNKLVDQEDRLDCQVCVSKFITDNFQDRRMFSIPDHPTNILYKYVMDEIQRLVGVELIASWPVYMPELQPEERTPIFPKIAAETGLKFVDLSWRSETQPLSVMNINQFLTLHFEAGRRAAARDEVELETVLATSNRPTWVNAAMHNSKFSRPIALPIFTQIVMRRRTPLAGDFHFTGDVVAVLTTHSALEETQPNLEGAFQFRTNDWIFRS